MPSDPNIGKREREVLTAIVETFISTGEPVGSRTLARSSREGLSPATIRNVMADLSDAGFLEQTHSSSGRIPTPDAYRYYVEQITGTTKLAPQEESMISDSLAGISDVQEFMERTSRVLSLISRNVGVTVATSGAKNALEHVYFFAPWRPESAGGVGDAFGVGARPRVEARSAAGGTGSCGAVYQRELSRLDDGIGGVPNFRDGSSRNAASMTGLCTPSSNSTNKARWPVKRARRWFLWRARQIW